MPLLSLLSVCPQLILCLSQPDRADQFLIGGHFPVQLLSFPQEIITFQQNEFPPVKTMRVSSENIPVFSMTNFLYGWKKLPGPDLQGLQRWKWTSLILILISPVERSGSTFAPAALQYFHFFSRENLKSVYGHCHRSFSERGHQKISVICHYNLYGSYSESPDTEEEL